ncbi:unnamed protein product [Mytilus coruscus]|uniref:Uncharacterized protein n=1 Tax=Mytilus coruscus TaxID=42192 RepID=A0A6J8AT32_MYTCO|nr:unnamed protein product [Mytilus coruscus]
MQYSIPAYFQCSNQVNVTAAPIIRVGSTDKEVSNDLCLFVIDKAASSILEKGILILQLEFQTLKDRVLGHISIDNVKSRPPPVFEYEQEARLVHHIKEMYAVGYAYTRAEVVGLGTEYAVHLGMKTKDDKQLSLRWYFDELDRIMEKYKLKDKSQSIYNVDEPPNVEASAEYEPSTLSSEKGQTTTVMGCGIALGHQIPPYFILLSTFRKSGIYPFDRDAKDKFLFSISDDIHKQTESEEKEENTKDDDISVIENVTEPADLMSNTEEMTNDNQPKLLL